MKSTGLKWALVLALALFLGYGCAPPEEAEERGIQMNYEVLHDEELLLQTVGRIRDVREAENGDFYVLNDESDAGLFRITEIIEDAGDVDGPGFPEHLGTQYGGIRVEQVASGLEHPWSVAFLPDDRYLVTERPGNLKIIDADGQITEVGGLPDIHAAGQGGLMEVSLHPDFETNSQVYLTYSQANEDDETATALARGELDGNQLTGVEDLFVQERYSSPGRHYGSRLAWTNEGYLLMSIGDRGADPPRAQDLSDHAGTLLRLTEDGDAVQDNPFTGQADAQDEIYSYGHRNIQGLVVDPQTNEIWATEHGPRGGDELNLIEAGQNYGWPTVTLGLGYGTQEAFGDAEARTMPGKVDPVYEFLPTHAPSGLAMVTTDPFIEQWDGNLLAGGLRSERIRRLVIDEK